MTDDRLITVAIHTYDKAVALKNLLEKEGIKAVLHNVNLSSPVISSGIRVRIKETDLPLALRIIENTEIFDCDEPKSSDNGKTIIVPVDFSEHSRHAAILAFDFAAKHKANILFLHSFINPAVSRRVQLTDSLTFELAESREAEKKMMNDARELMEKFESGFKAMIKSGELPPVVFSDEIREGVPEDVINETAKSISPLMIVMGTRGCGKKEEELMGSVTAEVLDSCRFPVFTVPESGNFDCISGIESIIFLCNLEQDDFIALETMSNLIGQRQTNITVICMSDKKGHADSLAAKNFMNYCRQHLPACSFRFEVINPREFAKGQKPGCITKKSELIVLPNKKRNAFFRLFNPTLAHRLLFHVEAPMLVIPV